MTNSHLDAKSIGAHLRTVRLAKAWTLEEVVRRSAGEFRATSLSSYERGERTISLYRLLRLATVFDVDPSDLLPAAAPPPYEVTVERDGSDPAGVRGRLRVQAGTHDVRVENLDLRQLRRQIDRALRDPPPESHGTESDDDKEPRR